MANSLRDPGVVPTKLAGIILLLGIVSETSSEKTPDLKAWARDPQSNNQTCIPRAIVEFPSDGFTYEERSRGWFLLHIFLSLYVFILLGQVCDRYFIPSIETICSKIGLSSDVAGATFMAAATSSPELFINLVGTFVTKGDLGVGTVVGSAVFNVLAVPAACGLFIIQPIKIDWWPITRDCTMYAITVICLILSIRDGQIHSLEAFLLVLLYFVYVFVMVFNTSIRDFVKKLFHRKRKNPLFNETDPLFKNTKYINHGTIFVHSNSDINEQSTRKDTRQKTFSIFSSPWRSDFGLFKNVCQIVMWPIGFLLAITIPDCRHRPSVYPLTFLMCMIWIGFASYFVAWMITVVGDTLNIPDSVMGITFLAAGTSVPEAVSSVLVTRQGHGEMGIANSIGSNTFDILLCLGLPWFLKSTFFPQVPGEYFIQLNFREISVSSFILFITLVLLYSVFLINRFRIDRRIGVIFLVFYGVYLLLSSFIELNYFGLINPPMCSR